MNGHTISLTDLKRNLGEIVNRAAYGRERIVLLSRGKPRAALISIEDLERLRALERAAGVSRNLQEQMDLLAELDTMREQMEEMTDSVEVLRGVREERLNDLMGLS